MPTRRAVAPGNLITVGRFASAHGIRGWINVQSFTDPPENLLSYKPWYMPDQHGWSPLAIDRMQAWEKGLRVHVQGIDDREQVRCLTGHEIAVAEEVLPKLEPGDYYWKDLMGLEVWTPAGECLGRVDHLMPTGSNDVLIVKPNAHSIDGRERLIPWLQDQIIRDIDFDARRILVDWRVDY